MTPMFEDNDLQISEIVAKAGLGIWSIIIKDGLEPRMIANDKMRELLGIKEKGLSDEEIYHAWYDNILPSELDSVKRSVNEMLGGSFSENTYQWMHPTKGVMYVRCGGTSVKHDDGTIILSGYHSDVTDLVLREQQNKLELREAKEHAEHSMKELEEQFDIIQSVAKAFNSLYYVDLRDMTFVELGVKTQDVRNIIGEKGKASDSIERMMKYLVVPEHVEKMREFMDLSTIDERLGDNRWISCQFISPVNGWAEGIFIAASRNAEGKCDHLIWATRNIDKDKKREIKYQKALEKATAEAKSASKAKTTFLFNMSHDIRTPMNAIIGYTELLERHQDDKEKRNDYIEKIRSSSDFLLSLINNVLEMARIESGKVTLDEEQVYLSEICNEIGNVYAELMKAKRIRFKLNVEVVNTHFYCDKVKLNEILLNLVSNAYKYTPEGGSIELTLRELPDERAGYMKMQAILSDTGIGMSKQYLPILFDAFSRERNTTDLNIQGTGLGMPIVKNLVEMMGGTITVESEVGRGTTFVVTLPHRIVNDSESVSMLNNSDTKNNCASFKGKRILLAEDNDLNAEIAMEILKEEGFLIERAEDGIICVDMLQKAEEGYYDLILMDIQMPNMDGYKATRIIRDMPSKQKSSIPIIAMTANAFEEDRKNAIDAGMNEHLSKPINVSRMMELLSSILE